MKKSISLLLVLAMLLSVCVCAAAEGTEDPMAKYRTGSPWVCVDLEGVVTEDLPADLKDNFALATNRDYYLNAVIPEGYPSTGAVDDLLIVNSSDVLSLFLEDGEFTDHDSQLVKAFYGLMMDWDTRNALGVTPLKTETDVIEGIETLDELIAYYLEYPVEKQLSAPFGVAMDTDLANPDLYIALATPCTTLLNDSAEYTELSELGALMKDAYHNLIVAILQKLDYSEERAEEMWNEAFHLDELMAPYIYTSDEMNSPDYISKIYNMVTRDEMLALQGSLPVVQYVEETCGFGRQDIWMLTSPAFYEGMQTIFTEENLPLLKSWIICQAAKTFSNLLDRDCYELAAACSLAITGTEALPDEIVATTSTQNNLAWQTAHMYCNKYFTQQDKDAIQSIIDDVIATYRKMLQSEDFIAEETKAAAIRKLDTLRIRTLFPDDWTEYTDPDLNFRSPAQGGTLVEALEAITRSQLHMLQEKVRKPVDHDLWIDGFTPITVNCFYNPTDNSINILAAFCRGDIYSEDMCYEEICGKIGLVVAHEISHAFDANGAQFDETGAFRIWWTEEDYALFSEKDRKMADYYSSMCLWEGENINGGIKTTEACADMGAMKCLLTMAAEDEDFDYDTFFRSYADIWRNQSNMYRTQILQKDTHSMGYLRINSVLQQFDEFLDFYGITEGDGMYLAESDRVLIW